MPCMELLFYSSRNGSLDIWIPLPNSDKENEWFAVFSLLHGQLASLWDVTLFPLPALACRNQRGLAGSGLPPINQARAVQSGE